MISCLLVNSGSLVQETGFCFKDGLIIKSYNGNGTWYSVQEFVDDYCEQIQDDNSYLEYLISLIPKQFFK